MRKFIQEWMCAYNEQILHLDIAAGVKAVHLVEQLQHGALDLTLTARLGLIALGADGVHLICSATLVLKACNRQVAED